ncbi:hypothetical protein RB534_22905, partial [Klebsiella pneumoniae]|uniref:hypothetical protein n=1 Tax=Klebsiella pneumoniae TaxID=573 RepID=UPI003D00A159
NDVEKIQTLNPPGHVRCDKRSACFWLRTYLQRENNADKRMPAYFRQDRADRQYKSWGSAGGSGIGRPANAGAVDLSLVN